MIDLSTPLVVNLALTGIVPRRSDNPRVPITPEEIARDVEACYQAGARVFHIHARDVEEQPTYRRETYAEIIRRIRRRTPAAVVCVSTSGRVHSRFEERSDVLDLEQDDRPDLASLTMGSMNFPREASINTPDMIRRLAARMEERGIVPEIEIFDFGMLDYAHYLIDRGVLKPPFVLNLLLGSLGTLAANGVNLVLLIERLPPSSFWSAAGIGRYQLSMNALGVALGGHVRTGLEDNLYMDPGKRELATNLALVQRLSRIAAALGRPIATPEQARKMLALKR